MIDQPVQPFDILTVFVIVGAFILYTALVVAYVRYVESKFATREALDS